MKLLIKLILLAVTFTPFANAKSEKFNILNLPIIQKLTSEKQTLKYDQYEDLYGYSKPILYIWVGSEQGHIFNDTKTKLKTITKCYDDFDDTIGAVNGYEVIFSYNKYYDRFEYIEKRFSDFVFGESYQCEVDVKKAITIVNNKKQFLTIQTAIHEAEMSEEAKQLMEAGDKCSPEDCIQPNELMSERIKKKIEDSYDFDDFD